MAQVAPPAAPPAEAPWPLSKCVRTALQSHPDARDAALAVQQARLRASDATATMLPSVSLDGAYIDTSSRNDQPDFVAANGPRERMAQLTLTQTLLDPTLPPLARAGKAQVESAVQDQASIRNEVALSTVQTVAEVLLSREEEAVLTAAWQQAQTQAAQVEALFQEGIKPRVDAAQSRLLTFILEKQVQEARGAVQASEDALSILMGTRPLPPLAGSLDAEGGPPPIPEGEAAVEAALAHRADVASALAAKHAAEERYSAARRAYWPKIKGEVLWGWDTLQPLAWDQQGWQGAVVLSMPVFTAGTLGREKAYQSMEVQKAADQVERVTRQVRSEVSAAFVAYRTASDARSIAEKASEVAEDVAKMSRTSFAEGTLSSLELSAAEKTLVQAQLERVRASLRADLARWACARAVGLPLPGTEPEPQPAPAAAPSPSPREP
jgi:outer membrane protein, multidrug efflux system